MLLLINSGVEQLAARKAHNLEVGGSSPPPAPIKALANCKCFLLSHAGKHLKYTYICDKIVSNNAVIFLF